MAPPPEIPAPATSPIARWTIALTLVFEAITIACRVFSGTTAAEFNQTNPPLLLQIHHLFWAVPFLVILPFVWAKPRVRAPLAGTALGLIFSDLLHHFVVLPLWVGNTGWHWP